MVHIEKEIQARKRVLDHVDEHVIEKIHQISSTIVQSIILGNKIISAGNGGSAANAQHITGDIVGRFKEERRGFAAISLTVEPSVITAVSNDYNYEDVFARQIEGFGTKGDVLIVLSSSAHSKNLVEAVKAANQKGIITIGILGNNGGSLIELLDFAITIPEDESDLAEEFAMSISHIILMIVEKKLVDKIKRGELV